MSISKRGKAAIEARKAAEKAEEADWAARSGPVEVRYLPGRGPEVRPGPVRSPER